MALTIDMTKGVYRRMYAGLCTGRRINAVSDRAFRLFWHIYMVADDFGNLRGDPLIIKAQAVPMLRQFTVRNIPDVLDELAFTAPPLIERYEVGGDIFIHVSDFERLQPGGKNGKRIKKVPGRVNPGESRLILAGDVQSSPAEVQVQDEVQVQSPLSPPKGGRRNRRLSHAEKQALNTARIAEAGRRE